MSAQLRLFDPQSLEAPESLTLRNAYQTYLLPSQIARGIAAGTLKDYETTLRHWSRLMESGGPIPIDTITDDTLERFADCLQFQDGKQPRSVDKSLIYVESILNRCGPRTPGNKRGRGILSSFVFAEKRDNGQRTKRRRVLSNEQLSQIYHACSVATWPRSPIATAPEIWRAWLVMMYHLGPSRTDSFLMPSTCFALGLSQPTVSLSPRCPIPELDVEHPYGWFVYSRTKTARRKPEPICVPMTASLRKHLLPFADSQSQLNLLPFPHAQRYWYTWLRKIQTEAGIEDPYTPQEFRKTCNVAWDAVEFGLGAYVLGHGQRDVNSRHYKAATIKLAQVAHLMAQPF